MAVIGSGPVPPIRSNMAQLQQEPWGLDAGVSYFTRTKRIYTIILLLMALSAAALSLLEPNVRFIPVWLFTSGLYGALAYALH